ncbi:MAG: fructosamine kinase family protein [Anaerolineae bacterium]|nr:fructosamine kinase family protein [Anaerolineae bacterium]
MVPKQVLTWLTENHYGQILKTQPVSGGCINNGTRLVTDSGNSFFLKTNAHCPPDMFAKEAEGLKSLTIPEGPRIPKSLLFGSGFLLLEDLCPASRIPDYWLVLGRQLATLHNQTASQFGFSHDNYLGNTPQPNPWMGDGFNFFAEHRLIYQAELARQRRYLSSKEVQG